jgi:hypothetical protein
MSQLFAIVPIPEHAAPPDNAIVVGTLDDVMTYIPQSISRQEAEQIRDAVGQALDYARQVQQHEASLKEQIQTFSDKCLTPVAARIDSFEKERAISAKLAEAEQKRRDRQRVQAYIDGLPDIDDPEPWPDNGELTIKHKVDPKYLPEDDTALGLEAVTATRPVSTSQPATARQPVSISLNED